MDAEGGRFFGTHFRSLAAGPFQCGLSRATVAREELPEHRHLEAHFILAVDAGYLSRAFDGPDEVGQGVDLIYNPPATEHRDCFIEPDGRFLSITAPAGVAPRGDRPLHLKAPGPRRLASRILGLCAKGGDDAALAFESGVIDLLACLCEQRQLRGTPRWLSQADELIHTRATEQQVTVSGLAAELRIHPVYFARAYRATRGHGPAAAIQHRRVGAAAAMLALDIGLSEIAFACGFADQSHLSRSVGKEFGLPPSALRAAFA